MALEEKTQQEILAFCQNAEYEKAADLLVGDTKDPKASEKIAETFKKIGPSITFGAISGINNVYIDSADIPSLTKKLENAVSNYTINTITMVAPKNNDEIKSAPTDEARQNNISLLRTKQTDYLKKHGSLDLNIASQLTTLLNENKPSVNQTARLEVTPIVQINSTIPEAGSEHWFVLPKVPDLERHESVKVVIGSPMTDILRDRYENQYRVNISNPLKAQQDSSIEAQFEQQKELNRQRSFIETYKDSNNIEDRDIYVHQIASKCTTDQYEAVESHTDKQDRNIKSYDFGTGQLIDHYDLQTKNHRLTINGEIPGAFTASIKRRTDSGRLIDDAYDVVEFRDGLPVLSAQSSKGNVALKYFSEIQGGVGLSDITLALPKSAEPHKILNERKESSASDLQKEPSVVEQKSEVTASIHPQDTLAASEQQNTTNLDTKYFRDQLASALAKPTSETTRNYLADQLAKAEGKPIDKIKEEFKITTPTTPEKSTQEKSEQNAIQEPAAKPQPESPLRPIVNKITQLKNLQPNDLETLKKIKEALVQSTQNIPEDTMRSASSSTTKIGQAR